MHNRSYQEKRLDEVFSFITGCLIFAVAVCLIAAGIQISASSQEVASKTQSEPVKVAVQSQSILSQIEGIDLPIPLSEKEIKLHALKDEALAIVGSLDDREKELNTRAKEIEDKKLVLEQREKIPAMAKGWYLMADTEPPKGRNVLFYSNQYANCPYKVMSYLGRVNKNLDFQLSIGNDDVQIVTSGHAELKRVYWTYLEDFDKGTRVPSDKEIAADRNKLTYKELQKGLTTLEVLSMYGEPSKRSVSVGYGVNEDRTWHYYKKRHNGHGHASNYLKFTNDKLVYWDLDFNFERV